MYDSSGSIGTPNVFFDRLKQAGIRVVEFNCIDPMDVKKSWAVNHRDHRKLLIVDGNTAFLGGINISSVYSTGSSVRGSDPPHEPSVGWRDTDIRIVGPVVSDFEQLFSETWNDQHGSPLARRDYSAMGAPAGKDIVRAIGSTPDDPYSLIYLTLISAITNAERQVYLVNAYFVPDPQLLKALQDAAARGVDVRLVLPSHSDSSPAFYAGRSHFSELLKSGIRIMSVAARCCTPKQQSSMGSGRASDPAIWIGAVRSTTTRSMRSFLDANLEGRCRPPTLPTSRRRRRSIWRIGSAGRQCCERRSGWLACGAACCSRGSSVKRPEQRDPSCVKCSGSQRPLIASCAILFFFGRCEAH